MSVDRDACARDGADGADVVVVGSGGAGLTAAAVAARSGRTVVVLERADVLGGTTAVSGGMLWVPLNPFMAAHGVTDTADDALCYLELVTERMVPRARLEQYVRTAPELVRWLHEHTPVRLFPIDRPDYHSEWPGARDSGRCLDNAPFPTADRPGLRERIRHGPHFPPLTYAERHESRWDGPDPALVAERTAAGVLTVGAALVAGLVAACDDAGVGFVSGTRAVDLLSRDDRIVGVRTDRGPVPAGSVVLASGGFEWNSALRRAFLGHDDVVPVGAPGAEGDGLLMALRAGAAVDGMSRAWWAPAVRDPAERYDGLPAARHLVGERCLPGSIVVNRHGRRFVNEAIAYHDLTKALFTFDPVRHERPNLPAWLVVDERYRRRYRIGPAGPGGPVPGWFTSAESVAALGTSIGVDPRELTATVTRFNAHAESGTDPDFGRGGRAHDRYYGDPRGGGNPCLGPLTEPPFHAVPLAAGTLGTSGGVVTDADGRVLRPDGTPLPGLFACGNVAASVMGPGYPGSGGTLGPALTGGYLCGTAIAHTTSREGRQ
ncbi:MAG TPA: FAD-dependent oxidoreductase [Pseudonocardia sp.]|nr:FAD-dependent oxidoreductase [Pseudonocardia sp.]